MRPGRELHIVVVMGTRREQCVYWESRPPRTGSSGSSSSSSSSGGAAAHVRRGGPNPMENLLTWMPCAGRKEDSPSKPE